MTHSWWVCTLSLGRRFACILCASYFSQVQKKWSTGERAAARLEGSNIIERHLESTCSLNKTKPSFSNMCAELISAFRNASRSWNNELMIPLWRAQKAKCQKRLPSFKRIAGEQWKAGNRNCNREKHTGKTSKCMIRSGEERVNLLEPLL
jgi:hypothetical protein